MVSKRGTSSSSSRKSATSESVRARASSSSASGSARSILIVSPARANSTLGNAVTAQRYAQIFGSLGWQSTIAQAYDGQPAACLVGLHAQKSARSIVAYRAAYPGRPVILVMTGTDLYRDIKRSRQAITAMDMADVLITLQPDGIRALPKRLRAKARAIAQSAPARKHRKRHGVFRICVLGHLRYEKDPMRAAYAVRRIDPRIHVQVLQAGSFLVPRYERLVTSEMERNPRYKYLGSLRRSAALSLLARSDVLVQSSHIEGGANTIAEAIACGTPVLASRISGNVGILGRRYPGLFTCGNTDELAALIERAACSSEFYERLRRACSALKPLVSPAHERAQWKAVLSSL